MKILEILKELNGYWQYDGKGKYLAELTSGKISDVFCNTGVLTTRPRPLEKFITELHWKYIKETSGVDRPCPNNYPQYVCSPATGAITLGYELARQFSCQAIFTEPKYEIKYSENTIISGQNYKKGDVERLIKMDCKIIKSGQELKRFDIPDGATILLAEDVITTGKSMYEMVNAIYMKNKNIKVLPYVLCLINRSDVDVFYEVGCGYRSYEEAKCIVISLADIKARTWASLEDAQRDYPNVIEAIRPKQNWNKLIGGCE